MAFKSDIDSQARGFFFAASGLDTFDGSSAERPKATMQAAIDAAAALNPIPTPGATATVIASQGGNFTAGITMADSVLVDAQNVTFSSNDPVDVEAADSTNYLGVTLSNVANGGKCININGKKSFGTQLLYAAVSGDDSFVFDISGNCESIFLDCSSIQVDGARSIGYNFTGVADSLLFLNNNQIDLLDVDCVGIRWAGTGNGSGQVGAITQKAVFFLTGVTLTGSNQTTAIKVESGSYSLSLGESDTDILCEVANGAELNLVCGDASGDIIVDAGGILNCFILDHTGSITNNGTINGIINGVNFGSYINNGLGYTLQWGGNLQTTGRFAQVSGITSGSQETGLSAGSEYIVPADGILDCLSYNTDTANTSTVFKITKNGAVEHTFNATGSAGLEESIGLSVVVGDLIAIEYDAGMRPAGSIYVAYID